jgi:hypothetical protein
VHVLVGVEAAALDNVAELNVSPELAVGAHANVVVDVETAKRVEDHVAPEPTIAANLQRPFSVGEGEGVELRVVAKTKLRYQDSGVTTDEAEVAEYDTLCRTPQAADLDSLFNDNALTNLNALCIDLSADV